VSLATADLNFMNILVDIEIVENFQQDKKMKKGSWKGFAKTQFQACVKDSRIQAVPDASKYFQLLKFDQSRFYDFLPIGYITLDEEGVIKSTNLFTDKMLGVKKGFLINTHFIDHIYLEDRKIFKLDGNCPSEMTHPSFDIRLKTKQGLSWTRVNVLINKSSRFYNRQIRLILCDINDLKQVEYEIIRLNRQLNQAKKLGTLGVLSSGIVHDFNSILSPIKGNLRVLMNATTRDRELHKALKNVLTSTKRVGKLAKQILEFTQQVDPRVSSIKIQPIIWEVLQLIGSTLPVNIKIIHTIDKECGPVMSDSTHIYQVVMKLITHALQAMEFGDGILDVKLKEIEIKGEATDGTHLIPGTYARLSVAYNAEVIDATTTCEIFDPHFKLKENGAVTGFSDIIRIVKNYGGDISFTRGTEKGCLFKVYIPRGYVFFDTTQVKYDNQ